MFSRQSDHAQMVSWVAVRTRISLSNRRRISLRVNGIRLAWCGCAVAFVGAGDGQEGHGEHGQDHPAPPGGPGADLVFVESGLAFGSLEGFLDGPSPPGDTDQSRSAGPGVVTSTGNRRVPRWNRCGAPLSIHDRQGRGDVDQQPRIQAGPFCPARPTAAARRTRASPLPARRPDTAR